MPEIADKLTDLTDDPTDEQHKRALGPGRCCYCNTRGEPTFVGRSRTDGVCVHVHEGDEHWLTALAQSVDLKADA